MNVRTSPVLFEFISVPAAVCHGSSFPITGVTGFCPLQVRPQYVSVLFKFDPMCLGTRDNIIVNIIFINFIDAKLPFLPV